MLSMSKNSTGDYEVGFGKPPKHSQFKKGQSGNLKGRPKSKKNVDTIVRDALLEEVTVTMKGGKTTSMSMLEAILHRTRKSALEGDSRSIDKVLKLMPVIQACNDREAADTAEREREPATDNSEIFSALAEMFLGGGKDIFLEEQMEVDDE